MVSLHGGELQQAAERLGCRPSQLLDASASLVPWTPRWQVPAVTATRDYPDRRHGALTLRLAAMHGLDQACVLPGNGAAELFTWAARDAAEAGVSLLPEPGFADYPRALTCWGGRISFAPLQLEWSDAFPQAFPGSGEGDVLWICNPHNPTGQLWSGASLERLLDRYALVICDEAFLPLVPDGEAQSLISLVAKYPNLVVIRSLTKLYGIAGCATA